MARFVSKPAFSDNKQEFYISELIGRKIFDNYGHQVGRVKDLVAVWPGGSPEVVGIKFASSTEIIPVSLVKEFGRQAIFLRNRISHNMVRRIKDDEVFVNRWLQDKQIVDIEGAKVVRVNDIKLRWEIIEDQVYITLIAVDVGLQGILRRLGLSKLLKNNHEKLLLWEHFKPLSTRTANLELLLPGEYLSDMHPADIADILENLSQGEQMEMLHSLDKETAADTLAEVDTEDRIQLLEKLDTNEVYRLIEEMSPDVAADVLSELPSSRSAEILELFSPIDARELRELMKYPEGTAGSLMTTEFITMPSTYPVSRVLNEIRELNQDLDHLTDVYVVNSEEYLIGSLAVSKLLTTPIDVILGTIMEDAVTLRPVDDFAAVLESTVKYDLLTLPVVDDQNHIIGVITVDDVLASLLDHRNRRYLEEESYLTIFRTLRRK